MTRTLSVRQTLFVDGFGSWGSEGPVEMFVAPILVGVLLLNTTRRD